MRKKSAKPRKPRQKLPSTSTMDLKFVCPSCEHRKLEEVCSANSVSTEIDDIAVDVSKGGITNVSLKYGATTEKDLCGVERYQCANCGHVVVDENSDPILNEFDLAAWLMAFNTA